ncbi:MAG: hypothetical protein AAGJ35_15805, partial [Myxococcota bacterium]
MLHHQEKPFSVEAWLSAHHRSLTRVMFPNEPVPDQVHVTKLVEKPMRLVVRMKSDDKAIIAKGFNRWAPRGAEANSREVAILESLSQTDLSPKLLGYSRANHWLIMEYVPGRRLDKVIKAENLLEYAKAV